MNAPINKAKSILILESNKSLGASLMELLLLEGFDIQHCLDGASGILKAKSNAPDVILCASKFSDIDCWEVIQALRRFKLTRKIPFICLSDDPLCDMYNPNSKGIIILEKPFSTNELLVAIRKSLILSA